MTHTKTTQELLAEIDKMSMFNMPSADVLAAVFVVKLALLGMATCAVFVIPSAAIVQFAYEANWAIDPKILIGLTMIANNLVITIASISRIRQRGI